MQYKMCIIYTISIISITHSCFKQNPFYIHPSLISTKPFTRATLLPKGRRVDHVGPDCPASGAVAREGRGQGAEACVTTQIRGGEGRGRATIWSDLALRVYLKIHEKY